jgi:hypothetical protein
VAELRALTVKQPWAHMIAHCGKRVENRSWRMDYRGDLAIHAGACSGWDPAGERSPVARAAWRDWSATLPPMNVTGPLRKGAMHIDFGAVIAVARVAGRHHSDDCMLLEYLVPPGSVTGCSAWAARGQWHIELADVRPLAKPVACRGRLGLWRLPEDVETAVRAQLEGA